MDFWYWSFALGACCVAWATVLLAHTGHDLEPWSEIGKMAFAQKYAPETLQRPVGPPLVTIGGGNSNIF